jgi:hypothetical protein
MKALNITWFEDSPDVGDPACLCSVCLHPIKEGESEIRAVSVYPIDREARFHEKCFAEIDGTELTPPPLETRPLIETRWQ